MKKMTKQILAFAMVAAVALTSIVVTPSFSESAKKPALSKKSAQLSVGDTLKIKVKNAKKTAKVTWKTSDKKVVKIAKKVTKGKKAYAKVKAVAEGTAKIKAAYKAGKTKKNLTCKITVKAAAEVASDSALTVATGTPAPAKGTATPAPAKGTATPKTSPTKTPKPTKTPGPTAPATTTYTLSASNANITNEYDKADITWNNDGSVKIVFDTQYEAVNFYLPNDAMYKNSKYTQVTIEYTSSGNALGYALFNSSTTFGDDRNGDDGTETGKVPNWDQDVVTGTVTRTIKNTDVSGVDYIRGIQIFNPAESGTTTITIKSIVFK